MVCACKWEAKMSVPAAHASGSSLRDMVVLRCLFVIALEPGLFPSAPGCVYPRLKDSINNLMVIHTSRQVLSKSIALLVLVGLINEGGGYKDLFVFKI